ncbi:MAG: peptidase M48, partial [Pseudomonadales bacterium]|nr:peptidase M48 [Pseudomonadales bacterium]
LDRSGYDPEPAVSLQRTFVELAKDRKTGWLEGLFSSHPPSQARVEANRETAAKLGYGGRLGEDSFDRAMAYLRSKDEAYEAFDEAHRLATKNELDAAMSQIDHALAIEPREARFYGLKGDIHFAGDEYRLAERQFTEAVQRDPAYYEYYLGRGLARARLGNPESARRDLERSNELLPTAIANNELGKISLAAGNRDDALEHFKLAMEAPGKLGQQATINYVRLDLPENPNKYIAVQVALTRSNTLVAMIRNRTDLQLGDIDVAFEINVNGETLRRVVTAGTLDSSGQRQVNSGWQFSSTDVLASPQISVVRARVL